LIDRRFRQYRLTAAAAALGLSVGGTLAVGGIGGTSSRHGMQTDQVLSLDVVTGSGQELTCSAALNADLFDAVRAGLGQCAIVTRATLRLVRAPQRARWYQLFYPNLTTLSADQRRVLADVRFDYLQGAILPDGAGGWRYQLDGAILYWGDAIPDDAKALAGLSDERGARIIRDATYGDDMLAFAKFAQLLKSSGHWFNPQPWLLTFLRGSDAEKIAGEILAELTDADLGPFGRITYCPMFTSAIRTPLVRMPDEEVVFPFNLIRIPASNDSAQVERMIAQNRVLYERIRDAGGVLYPVSAIPMSPDDWKDHFGLKWRRFEEAARHFDPRSILTPGYDIFGRA
jgi:cytokinin dehydrogenase